MKKVTIEVDVLPNGQYIAVMRPSGLAVVGMSIEEVCSFLPGAILEADKYSEPLRVVK